MRMSAAARRQPGPLAGTFAALFVAAVLVTMMASFTGTGLTMTVPAQRLAAAAVIVTGNQKVAVTSGTGADSQTDVLPLPAYRRVPASLTASLAAIPGVARAVAGAWFPVALQLPGGQVLAGLTASGWRSAVLAPFVLQAGHAPASRQQIVVGAGLARTAGLRTGDTVRLAGAGLPPFTVAGIAGSGRDSAQNSAVFLADGEAGALYAHPGQADLIGVIARPGVSAAALAGRVRAATAGTGLAVLGGAQRGKAEDLSVAADQADLTDLGTGAGIDLGLLALFVVASTVALSLAHRRRQFALLRAIGATPGQVRRMIVTELAVLAVLASVAAYLPGTVLARWVLHGLAAHQFVPAGAQLWTSWLVPLITAGAGLLVAELAGLCAGRRAGRVSPAQALTEADLDRRWPHPVRVLLGTGALAGGVAQCVVIAEGHQSAVQQLSLTFAMLLTFLIAIALLGPLLVAVAELAVRLPIRLIAGAGGRLALADIKARPRRMTAAVVCVALGAAFAGSVYLIDATQTRAAAVQGRQRLAASEVISAPGPGLAPGALGAIAGQPGVAAAVGLTQTTVFVPDPGDDMAAADAITGGPLAAVLDLDVVSGSLAGFGPGDIALSKLVAGRGAVGAHVGERITAYLADGTPYQATVTAIFARSLGFADVLVPSKASGGGHLGGTPVGQILVRNSGQVAPGLLRSQIAGFASRYPGLAVASTSAANHSVVNAQAEQFAAQSSYINDLLLWLIASLAAVALVDTLVMAAIERRESLLLLRRIGATAAQLLAMTTWQTLVLNVIGVILGAAPAAGAVAVASRALTGSYQPYLTWPPAVIIVGLVLVLSAMATAGPTVLTLSRRQP